MIRLLRARAAADTGGQILVMVGVGMVAFIAAVGLVIDVGFAFAANRRAQNGVDAAAHAGAIVIVKEIASDTTTENDANVLSAIEAAANANEIDFEEAWYTDWEGNQLVPPVEVGSLGTAAIPAGAQGVVVDGTLTHTTFFAQLIGISELEATGEATAVGGPASEPCPGTEACAFVPITFPTTVVTCDGQNKSVPAQDAGGNPYEWSENTDYVIPLCGNNPGSVGWLDWYTPQGGISELAAEICDPNPPELNLPDWFEVTATGNVNAQSVEDCLNKYAGQYILMPMFDDTCRVNPGEGNPCTQPAATGQQQWYHFPAYAVFQLDSPKGAYVNGNNSTACAGAGGNGATTCLIGRFVDAVGGGSVGPVGPGANTPSSFYAVQLIR